jgi:hypothetical protein
MIAVSFFREDKKKCVAKKIKKGELKPPRVFNVRGVGLLALLL